MTSPNFYQKVFDLCAAESIFVNDHMQELIEQLQGAVADAVEETVETPRTFEIPVWIIVDAESDEEADALALQLLEIGTNGFTPGEFERFTWEMGPPVPVTSHDENRRRLDGPAAHTKDEVFA